MVSPAGDPAVHKDPVGPVPASRRIVALDVLRGVAVLGILVMNIYAFAMPFAAYANPLVWGGTDALNLGTWFVTHIFFDQKFMTIFSMLFGAGLILMHQRAQARDAAFGNIFLRRQGWLIVFGLVHAYLVWFGDILFMYGVVGILAYLFRNLGVRTLVIVGCALLLVAPLFSIGGGAYMQDLKAHAEVLQQSAEAGEELTEAEQQTVDEWSEMRAFIMPGDAEISAEVDAYRGSYRAAFEHRAPFALSFQTDGLLFFGLWRVGGLMLLGMALMKSGVLANTKDNRFYRKLAVAGYALGLPLTLFSAFNGYAHRFDGLYMFQVGNLVNYLGSVLVAFGHIGLVMMWCRSGALTAMMQRFAAVGQMALSNYLMHSIVMTAIFYGWGLGLYGQVPRAWQMVFVALVIGVQLLLSPWWLARYRFGPLEWLWRSLTYGRRQPLVRN